MKRIKYRLPIAKKFPHYHQLKGMETGFKYAIENAIYKRGVNQKKHTIRLNYKYWKAKFEKINRGVACLVTYEWEDRPYHSKAIDLMTLDKFDGIGIQKLEFKDGVIFIDDNETELTIFDLAENDALKSGDFIGWFKDDFPTDPYAIIHFTSFRY